MRNSKQWPTFFDFWLDAGISLGFGDFSFLVLFYGEIYQILSFLVELQKLFQILKIAETQFIINLFN